MTTTAARPRASLALAPLAGVLAAITVIAGLAIKATTGALGAPLPPFVFGWQPTVSPLMIVSAGVLAIAAALAPRLALSVRTPFACATTLYSLALLLGLSLNLARTGTSGWWSVFARGPGGSREAAFEYLPGLPVLRHGVGAYVGHFAQLVPSLPLHAAGNPPAPLVVLHVLRVASPEGLAAVCIGVGALTAPLAYDLGRTLGGEQRGRTAGLLTAFTPSLLLFGVTSADYAFAAMGVGVACLIARPGLRFRIAGALLAAAVSLFSWLLLAIPAWGGVLALRRAGPRSALALAGMCAAAILALNLALALSTGYDPIATLRATDAVYRRTTADRPYAFWAFGSVVAWGVMLGPATARLALRALAGSDPAALAVAAVALASAMLGFTKGETERIWLPFTPLACVSAAAVLPRERLARTLAALAAQAVLVELLFNTIW